MPEHVAQVEACKQARIKTEVDYTPLLLAAPAQTGIIKQEEMLEPADIALQFGIKGKISVRGNIINKFLEQIGWQKKTDNGWIPTPEGDKYAVRHQWTANGKSGYNYKWNVYAVEASWKMSVDN